MNYIPLSEYRQWYLFSNICNAIVLLRLNRILIVYYIYSNTISITIYILKGCNLQWRIISM